MIVGDVYVFILISMVSLGVIIVGVDFGVVKSGIFGILGLYFFNIVV